MPTGKGPPAIPSPNQTAGSEAEESRVSRLTELLQNFFLLFNSGERTGAAPRPAILIRGFQDAFPVG